MRANNSLFSDRTIAPSKPRAHSRRMQIVNQHSLLWVHQLGIYPSRFLPPILFIILFIHAVSPHFTVYVQVQLRRLFMQARVLGSGPVTRDPEIVYGKRLFDGGRGRRTRRRGRGRRARRAAEAVLPGT